MTDEEPGESTHDDGPGDEQDHAPHGEHSGDPSGDGAAPDRDDDGDDRGRPGLADRRDLDTVYQPAEDTRLLAEAVTGHVDAGDLVLDVGTGSGYVGHVAHEQGARVVAADLNPHACREARERGLSVVRGDLLAPFRADSFDLVLFNPPYLPTPPDQAWGDWMEPALSGGEDGRRLVDPFLEDVGRLLKPGGEVLLLISSLTDVDAVTGFAAEQGLDSEEVSAEKFPFERLVVLRLWPSGNNLES
jgi:release factor glutamine methyltransferase